MDGWMDGGREGGRDGALVERPTSLPGSRKECRPGRSTEPQLRVYGKARPQAPALRPSPLPWAARRDGSGGGETGGHEVRYDPGPPRPDRRRGPEQEQGQGRWPPPAGRAPCGSDRCCRAEGKTGAGSVWMGQALPHLARPAHPRRSALIRPPLLPRIVRS
jgi:hypothetical protein